MTGPIGVSFKKVTIVWDPYSETMAATALSAIFSKEISKASRGTKFEYPIPPGASNTADANKPIFYPMGKQGETVKLTAYIKTSENFALWDPIVQGDLLYVYASEYEELPASSYWWVDANTISRKGGMAAADMTGAKTGLWNHELTVIRSYRKGDQKVR
ncbi:MAG TPA: hypothetical protein PL124_10815 [Candidatus Cloacimonadota bacterium]|nr:hypothetical protein [Candidatus Cloacimonadota bacterium]